MGQSAPLPCSLVAVGTKDGFVKLLDGETIRPHAHLSVSRDLPKIVAVDLSQGTGLLIAASSDHALRLLDLRAQRLLHTMRGHIGALSACGFLRGGSTAFTASLDRTLKLWDLEKGQTLRSLPTSCPVTGAGMLPALALSPRGMPMAVYLYLIPGRVTRLQHRSRLQAPCTKAVLWLACALRQMLDRC